MKKVEKIMGFMYYKKSTGFTLIELMITLGIAAILIVAAAPSFTSFFERKRLVSAVETISQQLQYARSESISRSANVIVKLTGGGSGNTWQMGLTNKVDCTPSVNDVTNAAACTLAVDADLDGVLGEAGELVLHRWDNTDFTNVDMTSPTAAVTLTFDSIRGTVSANQDITFASTGNVGYVMTVKLGLLGQIKLCSPAGATQVTGYSDC